MKQTMNRLTALICAFSLFFATVGPAYAEDETLNLDIIGHGVVTNLEQGAPAPFTGILLSPVAAARLFADLKFTEKECQLKLVKELDIASINYNAQIDSLKLRLDIENERTTTLLNIKNERIEFLEENWRSPAWYESGEFWLAVGIITGVLITVSAGYAINEAGK